jgi:hypothetical protein
MKGAQKEYNNNIAGSMPFYFRSLFMRALLGCKTVSIAEGFWSCPSARHCEAPEGLLCYWLSASSIA